MTCLGQLKQNARYAAGPLIPSLSHHTRHFTELHHSTTRCCPPGTGGAGADVRPDYCSLLHHSGTAQHSHHSPAQSTNGLVRIRIVRTLSMAMWWCRSPGQLTQHSLQYTPQFCIIHIMSPSHDTQWKVHLATLVRTDNISAHMSTAGYIYVNYPSNKKFPPHATPHLGPHMAGSGVS